MITLYLTGGLGNQLFNYAAARSLADRHQTDLIVDATNYASEWTAAATRPLLLHRFPVRARFRNVGSTAERLPLPQRLLRRLRHDTFATHVDRGQHQVGYFPEFDQVGKRAILRGHFISPIFFAGFEERIAKDLALDEACVGRDGRLLSLLDEIRHTANSVSVHVRRGDLLSPENAALLMPSMDSYYKRAISAVLSNLDGARLYCFSDDPEWCVEHLATAGVPLVVVSEAHTNDPLPEFFLMTQCRHHIIANSTFSWWGAWLAHQPSAHVIAPARWESNGAIDMSTFLPPEWNRLEWD